MVCCGYRQFELGYNPLELLVAIQTGQDILAWETCSGMRVDLTGDFYGTWWTEDSSIATVDAYGTHTGVAPGSTTTLTGPVDEQTQVKVGDCPIAPLGPDGSDNVFTASHEEENHDALPNGPIGLLGTTAPGMRGLTQTGGRHINFCCGLFLRLHSCVSSYVKTAKPQAQPAPNR